MNILQALTALLATITTLINGLTITPDGQVTEPDGTTWCVTASPCDYANPTHHEPSLIATPSQEWADLDNGRTPTTTVEQQAPTTTAPVPTIVPNP